MLGIARYDIAPSGSICLGNGIAGPVLVNVNGRAFSAPSTPGVYFINATANWDCFCTPDYPILDADYGPNTVAVLVVEP